MHPIKKLAGLRKKENGKGQLYNIKYRKGKLNVSYAPSKLLGLHPLI